MDSTVRYRSYTTYSEENGKLVPSIEPYEKDAKFKVIDEVILVDRITGKKWSITTEEKKLKSETNQKEAATLSK